jgi:putative addiction module component (TIGR02574 family)
MRRRFTIWTKRSTILRNKLRFDNGGKQDDRPRTSETYFCESQGDAGGYSSLLGVCRKLTDETTMGHPGGVQMPTSTKQITQAALGLPRKSRAALVEKLLESLDEENDLLEAAKEAERRMKAYERGEMGAKPLEEVLRSFPKKRKK